MDYAQQIQCADNCDPSAEETCYMYWDDAAAGSGRDTCDNFNAQYNADGDCTYECQDSYPCPDTPSDWYYCTFTDCMNTCTEEWLCSAAWMDGSAQNGDAPCDEYYAAAGVEPAEDDSADDSTDDSIVCTEAAACDYDMPDVDYCVQVTCTDETTGISQCAVSFNMTEVATRVMALRREPRFKLAISTQSDVFTADCDEYNNFAQFKYYPDESCPLDCNETD